MKKLFITLLISYIIAVIVNNILLTNTQNVLLKEYNIKPLKIKFFNIRSIPTTNKQEILNVPNKNISKKNIVKDVLLSNKINILAIIIDGEDKKVFFTDKVSEYFLSVNDKYKKYTIIDILRNKIKLLHNNQITIIKFDKNQIDKEEYVEDIEINETNLDNDFIVEGKTLDRYIKNPRKALREINVSKSKGRYIINRLKNNSIFYNLGVRKNDIIVSLNEEPVSESLFLKLYKNYKKYDSFNIEVERDGKILEFNYEIER